MFDSIHPLLPWLATYLLHSTALLGGALLAARWIRNPAAREVLWKAALVAGFLTAGLHGRFGGGVAIAVLPGFDGSAPATLGLAMEGIEEVAAAQVDAGSQAAPATALARVTDVDRMAETDGFLAGVRRALVPVWLLGAGWLVLGLALAYRTQSRRLSARCSVRCGELRATLRRLARRMTRLGHVRLTESAALPSPVALGRREICVPSRARSELTAGEQEGMLAHELAHLARRDPAWLCVAHVIERVFFFQPLNRVVRRRFQEDAEYACDEAAARELAEPVELARCLARVATWIDASPGPRLAVGMAAEPSALVGRVERILAARETALTPVRSRVWALVGSGICIAALACAGPGVRGASQVEEIEEDHGQAEPPEMDRRLLVRIDVIEAGVRIHPETREPYSGTGRFLYDDSRRLRYTVGEAVTSDLDTLARHLKDVPVDGTRVDIDTRSGVVYQDVARVLDRIIYAGFTHVSFVNGDHRFSKPIETYMSPGGTWRPVEDRVESGGPEPIIAEIIEVTEEPEEPEVVVETQDPDRVEDAEFIEEEPAGTMWVPDLNDMRGPHDDEPVVVTLSPDGTLSRDGRVVVAGRGGRLDDAAVKKWLRATAAAMPHERLGGGDKGPRVATGRLRLVGGDRTLFWDVQKIMEWCGAHDVQIYKVEFARRGDPQSVQPAWLPIDMILDEEAPPKIDIRIRVRDETPGSRVLEYSCGPKKVRSLQALEPALQGFQERLPGAVISIDARPGTLQGEVLDLLELVEGVGWQKVMYVGAYAWEGR